MIYWSQLFHFYQPPTQIPSVLDKICNESYRPLLNVLHRNPHVRTTININGVLLEMLYDYGHRDIIKSLRLLGEKKLVEFTGTGKYHPILPLTPPDERKRQIELNVATSSRFLGKAYSPKGIFPPEMCYSDEILLEVSGTGHQWIILSGIACPNNWPIDKIYQVEQGDKRLAVFFRDDILSNKVSYKQIGARDFIEHLKQMGKDKNHVNVYVVTAMDAETYGHHHQDWEEVFLATVYGKLKTSGAPAGIRRTVAQSNGGVQPAVVCPACDTRFLITSSGDLPKMGHVTCPNCETEILVDFEGKKAGSDKKPETKSSEHAEQNIKAVSISDLLGIFPPGEVVSPKASSWSASAEDLEAGNPYPLWMDKDNEIHRLQWEHLSLCIEMVKKALECSDNDESAPFGEIARGLLDAAEHSCQFWWASRKPYWEINLIHLGLINQWRVIVNAYRSINKSGADAKTKTTYYHKLIAARDVRNKIVDRLFIL